MNTWRPLSPGGSWVYLAPELDPIAEAEAALADPADLVRNRRALRLLLVAYVGAQRENRAMRALDQACPPYGGHRP